ncbi:GNAT family acetyltransferase [Penicillium macrosclerotiorum]|uniref:GNAT family acetyltransferase n=1 Tax=Penicillium macrosclerotiorum TaxID=303699 RepID=UPI00254857F8|nr:GNAT family acetyltransferase [Penicillium macrosclerotiorum]KAJ5699094.1 GNAT family acetyltransferase [Penicillium macrosclerotiorum]
MAYQFFKGQSQPSNTSAGSSPSPSRHTRPPIHPPPPQPPRSASTNTNSNRASLAFTPYEGVIPAGYATSHPHITVEKISTAHIPSFTRITGLLLPIRYPNSFYTATIVDPIIASLSRVALYHDHPVAAAPDSSASTGTDKVIGGIRCRLEKQESSGSAQDRVATNLYIQTLHLLSPYRGHGVAAALLNSLLFESPLRSKGPCQVSNIVKHYNIRSVTAHVHEANEDGLRWYVARGFQVQEGIVEGYYRRLQPSGAKIASQRTSRTAPEDEDWEKVEAEDEDDDDHGVQLLGESQILEKSETPTRKRKAEDDGVKELQRR